MKIISGECKIGSKIKVEICGKIVSRVIFYNALYGQYIIYKGESIHIGRFDNYDEYTKIPEYDGFDITKEV